MLQPRPMGQADGYINATDALSLRLHQHLVSVRRVKRELHSILNMGLEHPKMVDSHKLFSGLAELTPIELLRQGFAELANLPRNHHWLSRVFTRLCRLHLLCQAILHYQTITTTEIKIELEAVLGLPKIYSHFEVDQLYDVWTLLCRTAVSSKYGRDETYWLFGEQCKRWVMLKRSLQKHQLNESRQVGERFQAALRITGLFSAVLECEPQPVETLESSSDYSAFEHLRTWKNSLLFSPWRDHFPLLLCDTSMSHRNGQPFLELSGGALLPVSMEKDFLTKRFGDSETRHFAGLWDGMLFHLRAVWQGGSWSEIDSRPVLPSISPASVDPAWPRMLKIASAGTAWRGKPEFTLPTLLAEWSRERQYLSSVESLMAHGAALDSLYRTGNFTQ